MCGLAGAISLSKTVGLFSSELETFKQLGIISQLRGSDSTGVMSMSKAGTKKERDKGGRAVYVHKQLGNSSNFFDSEEGKRIVYRPDTFFVAMHCRFATVGDVTEANAHPFKCGSIYGMHNGTINGLAKDDRTDSEVLLSLINEHGDEHTLKNYVKGGAYALVYVNLKDQTLNIIRNAHRSLYMMEVNQVIYYASEFEMLSLVRSRQNLGFAAIKLFETEVFYRYSLKDLTVCTQEKLHKPLVYSAPSIPKETFEGTRLLPKEEKKEEKPPFVMGPSAPKKVDDDEEVKFGDMYFAFRGKKLNLDQATQRLKCGCTLCKKRGSLNGKAYWYNNSSWVCEVCREDPVTQMYIKEGDFYEGVLVQSYTPNLTGNSSASTH